MPFPTDTLATPLGAESFPRRLLSGTRSGRGAAARRRAGCGARAPCTRTSCRWRTPRRAQPSRTVPRGCAEFQPPCTHGTHAESRTALPPKSPNFTVSTYHALAALVVARKVYIRQRPKFAQGGAFMPPGPLQIFLAAIIALFFFVPKNENVSLLCFGAALALGRSSIREGRLT